MRTRELRGVGAYDIVHSMPSVHAACLAVAFGVRGVSYAICGACAASAQCIGHAVELIRAAQGSSWSRSASMRSLAARRCRRK